jgi:hypothetical protein
LRLVRDVALDDVGEVERQRDGQDDHHRAADRAEGTLMTFLASAELYTP